MLIHSPPNTLSQSNPVALDAQRHDFNPYVPTSDSVKDERFANAEVQALPNAASKNSYFEDIANVYGAGTRMFGFDEKYSLGLCACKHLNPSYQLTPFSAIFFGGALIGFCLARTMMMSPTNLRDLTIPGGRLSTCVASRAD